MNIDQILNFLADNPAWIVFISFALPMGGYTLFSLGIADEMIGTPGKHKRVSTSVPVERPVPLKVRDKFDFDKITHYYNTV